MSASLTRSVFHVRSADGTRIGVERFGSGPPVVLVHGGTADRTRWAPVTDQLAQRFELHLMDRRGRGDSRDEAPGYDIAREVEDVAAVLDLIESPPLVVAHSYGATCVLAGLERIAATAAAVLLYEPAFATIGHLAVDEAVIQRWEVLLAADEREEALVLFYQQVIGLPAAAIDQMRGTPIWNNRVAAMHTVLREAKAGNNFRPAHSDAARSAPVRILVGEETAPWLAAAARAAHAALEGSELATLPGQGHIAIDTAPELFISEIVQLHERVSARTSAPRVGSPARFVGSWRLVSFEARTGNGEVIHPFGADAEGVLTYTPDGRVSATVYRAGRLPFAIADQQRGTPEEYAAAVQSYVQYVGTWRVDREAGTVAHEIEQSIFPNWNGDTQVRYFRFDDGGDRLELTTPPTPFGGTTLVGALVWERA